MLPTGDEMNQFSPSFPMMLLSVIEEENVVGRSDVARLRWPLQPGFGQVNITLDPS